MHIKIDLSDRVVYKGLGMLAIHIHVMLYSNTVILISLNFTGFTNYIYLHYELLI